jgi:outer membrane protein TolC
MTKLKKTIIFMILAMISFGMSAQPERLTDYLETAVQNNPGLKTDFLAYQASLQKIPQAGAIPDPQLDMGFFLKPMDIIDGSRVADFTLMQMFPWFGTRKSAQTEANHMANMAFEKFRETRDNLYLNVYTQWFILCSLQQKLINSQEHKQYLEQLETLSLRKYASPTGNTVSSMGGSQGNMGSGVSGLSDVLRIQLETAELENNIERLLSEIKSEKARFNTLLNRPAESEVEVPDTFEQIPFILDIPSAMERIATQNPMLGMLNEEALAYKAKQEMDKKMSYPMLGVGLQYSLLKKRTAMEIPVTSMNGMDMLMPMLSVSIPIYRNKYKAQQKEGQLRWQSSREKYANTMNALETELFQTKHLLDDASRQIRLLEKQTKLANTAYNLMVQEFVTGKSDLTNVIQVQRQLLDYRLRKAEAIASFNTMVANAQRLISFNETK